MKAGFRVFFVLLGFQFLILPVFAQDKAVEKGGVLNFEGEVIEGQKKTPDIFLQTEVQKPVLESVLYQRKDFNDFHVNDSKQRPRLPDAPKKGTQRK